MNIVIYFFISGISIGFIIGYLTGAYTEVTKRRTK